MTRDEIERADRMLKQGLDLDRAFQRRLVDHLLANQPLRKHIDGCAWWRGAGCDCQDTKDPWDAVLGGPGFTYTCRVPGCPTVDKVSPAYPTAAERDAAADLHSRAAHGASKPARRQGAPCPAHPDGHHRPWHDEGAHTHCKCGAEVP